MPNQHSKCYALAHTELTESVIHAEEDWMCWLSNPPTTSHLTYINVCLHTKGGEICLFTLSGIKSTDLKILYWTKCEMESWLHNFWHTG